MVLKDCNFQSVNNYASIGFIVFFFHVTCTNFILFCDLTSFDGGRRFFFDSKGNNIIAAVAF